MGVAAVETVEKLRQIVMSISVTANTVGISTFAKLTSGVDQLDVARPEVKKYVAKMEVSMNQRPVTAFRYRQHMLLRGGTWVDV